MSDRKNFSQLLKESYSGSKIGAICVAYQYRGYVAEVGTNFFKLDHAAWVDVSDRAMSAQPDREDQTDRPIFVAPDAVELFFQPNWAFAPLMGEPKKYEYRDRPERTLLEALDDEFRGEKIVVLCARYQYRGILSEVGDDHFVLANAVAVESASSATSERANIEDPIGSSIVIKSDSIESVWKPLWADAPLPGETNENKSVRQWLARLDFISKEYPFGPNECTYDQEGMLHNESGRWAYISPSRCIQYENGKKMGIDVDKWGSIQYYFRGVLVPPRYILSPESLVFEEILKESNAEVRRVGVIIYGFDRMIEEEKFELIHTDLEMKAELYRHTNSADEEPTVVVRVTDATPKDNGEYQRYILTVPPEMQTCREAIAWTFRKSGDEYNPVIET